METFSLSLKYNVLRVVNNHPVVLYRFFIISLKLRTAVSYFCVPVTGRFSSQLSSPSQVVFIVDFLFHELETMKSVNDPQILDLPPQAIYFPSKGLS